MLAEFFFFWGGGGGQGVLKQIVGIKSPKPHLFGAEEGKGFQGLDKPFSQAWTLGV